MGEVVAFGRTNEQRQRMEKAIRDTPGMLALQSLRNRPQTQAAQKKQTRQPVKPERVKDEG